VPHGEDPDARDADDDRGRIRRIHRERDEFHAALEEVLLARSARAPIVVKDVLVSLIRLLKSRQWSEDPAAEVCARALRLAFVAVLRTAAQPLPQDPAEGERPDVLGNATGVRS
jgi:hypothetical protein